MNVETVMIAMDAVPHNPALWLDNGNADPIAVGPFEAGLMAEHQDHAVDRIGIENVGDVADAIVERFPFGGNHLRANGMELDGPENDVPATGW